MAAGQPDKERAESTRKKSPVRVRAQRLSPDQRRQQLLDSALVMFSEKGLGNGKHTDLAQVAAVAVPTTFHYFPTREDLISAALDEVARFLIEDIVNANQNPSLPAPEIVRRILLSFTDAIQTYPQYVRVWLEWSSSVRDGLWEQYLRFYRTAIRKIKIVVNQGKKAGTVSPRVNADDAARIVVGLAHMITQMKFAGNSRATIEHTVSSYLDSWSVGL